MEPNDQNFLSVSSFVAHAREAMENGDLANARALFTQAVEEDRSDVLALHGLALLCYEEGDLIGSRERFSALLADSPPLSVRADALIRLGNIAYDEGDLESASVRYQAVYELDLDRIPAHERQRLRGDALFGMGIVMYDRGQLYRAAELFYEAIQEDPQAVGPLVWYADICGKTAKFEDAIQIMRQAIRLSPYDEELQLRIGSYYEAVSHSLEARTHYERALELGAPEAAKLINRLPEENGDDWMRLAHDYEDRGDLQWAEYAYERAAQLGEERARMELLRLDSTKSATNEESAGS